MMELTQADCENLIDALQEWDDTVGPKELGPNEVGLDSDRFEDLIKRLREEGACVDFVDRGEGIESCEETPGPNYLPDLDLDK